MTRFGSFLALALAAGLLACQDSTSPPVPARIDIVLGDSQTSVVAALLPVQPTVVVLTSKGKPLSNISVTFELETGGGQISRQQQLTDAQGHASPGAWTLGTRAGVQTLTARVTDAPDVTVTLKAIAQPGEGVRMGLKRLASPSALSGVALANTPSIQITDAYGNAVARAGVVVTATAGGARVRNDVATTDSAGVATFNGFTLSGPPGTYALRFSAPSYIPLDANLVALGIGPAAKLVLVTGPPASVVSGVAFTSQPVIELQDDAGNRVTATPAVITATLASGTGILSGDLQVVTDQGIATFTNLRISGNGPFRIDFSTPGVPTVSTNEILIPVVVVGCPSAGGLQLNYTLGQSTRFRVDQGAAPQCLQFDLARNQGQQYLMMIENIPRTGFQSGAGSGLFPGPESGSIIGFTVTSGTLTGNMASIRSAPRQMVRADDEPHSWNFGDGEIYEAHPPIPAGGVPAPRIIRGRDRIDVNSVNADPVVGDTILVYLAGVDRLGTVDGDQRAVIRHVSNDLIIAEDARLLTMPRAGGGYNTPLSQADMDSISRAYSAHTRAQSDLLFENRHNRATETQTPPRIVAVHTLMFADNIWGYTYMTGNVFAWDYWVATNGSTKGLAQHPLRNAHNLFMHEITHMRHWGLLERAGRTNNLGNVWLIEGFARFSERLPIGAYLMNSGNPSRTGNVNLGAYPEFGGSRFREDVPSYLNVGFPMLDGYAASSYVFDYLADQVALAGGDWRRALTRFVANAGTEADANAAVNAALPGLTFEELFTRARIAAYTDDIGTPGLPSWTQYHQFNLRGSREPSTAASFDPRNAWPKIEPGVTFGDNRGLFAGAAYGYLIDGVNATDSGRIFIDFTMPNNAVISITRIR